MKYLLSICLLLLLLLGCHQDKPAITKGKYFFDFDQVVYYKTNVKTEYFRDIISNKKLRKPTDSLFIGLFMKDTPKSLSDTVVISLIEKIGYAKKNINKSKNAQLNELFRQKHYTDSTVFACDPFYRDIFIFKKKGKITGVAKLCYECGISSFTGTDVHTYGFGKNGEFEKLKELVK